MHNFIKKQTKVIKRRILHILQNLKSHSGFLWNMFTPFMDCYPRWAMPELFLLLVQYHSNLFILHQSAEQMLSSIFQDYCDIEIYCLWHIHLNQDNIWKYQTSIGTFNTEKIFSYYSLVQVLLSIQKVQKIRYSLNSNEIVNENS